MVNIPKKGEATQRSHEEKQADLILREKTIDFLTKNETILDSPHWNWHLSTFLRRQTLSRLLYLDELYKRIIDVPGVILEFGVQHGATISVLNSLRGIHEPFNHSRTIVGFDTFEGLASINSENDPHMVQSGQYTVSNNWELELDVILTIQQQFSPLSHINKFELVKGNLLDTLPNWLDKNPGQSVAMVIFDVDIYEPTKFAIEKVIPRLTKRSLLVFDEFSCKHFAGETVAAMDSIGLNRLNLYRSTLQPYCAFGYLGD